MVQHGRRGYSLPGAASKLTDKGGDIAFDPVRAKTAGRAPEELDPTSGPARAASWLDTYDTSR